MTIAEEQRHYRYERAQLQRRSSIQRIQRSGSYASPGFVVALSLGLMAAIAFFAAALQLTTAFVVQAPIGGLVARTSRSGNNLDRGRRPTKIFLEGAFFGLVWFGSVVALLRLRFRATETFVHQNTTIVDSFIGFLLGTLAVRMFLD